MLYNFFTWVLYLLVLFMCFRLCISVHNFFCMTCVFFINSCIFGFIIFCIYIFYFTKRVSYLMGLCFIHPAQHSLPDAAYWFASSIFSVLLESPSLLVAASPSSPALLWRGREREKENEGRESERKRYRTRETKRKTIGRIKREE